MKSDCGAASVGDDAGCNALKRKAPDAGVGDASAAAIDSHSSPSKPDDNNATAAFSEELKRAGLTLFQPLSSHGYFAWDPSGALSPNGEPIYTPLSDIASAEEVLQYADLDGRPDKMIPMEGIRRQLPKAFLGREQFDDGAVAASFDSRFPFGEVGIASLGIAARRGVNFNEVDFSFGGSTLHFLASKGDGKKEGRYIARRIPGTKCIFVANRTQQKKEPTNIGFQFERLVTGGDMSDASSLRTVEHLHTMRVGTNTVLFRAEVDALDDNGAPVEAKVSPASWTTAVLLQMVSNGSLSLCKGTRAEVAAPKIRKRGYALGGGRGVKQKVLTAVEMLSLSEVAALAFERADAATVEGNITEAMEAMQIQMKDEGAYELGFAEDGSLRLEDIEDADANAFPSREVVERLIG